MPVEPQTDGIELEEIEGDRIGSRNYRFSRIGESVPIINSDEATFDPQSLPSQPLAVSERFRLLFIAHPHGQGFYVARTKDVMASAEAIKDKKTAASVQELSLVDVPIGKVSILALSADESLLVATVSCHVYFFAVSALLHKDQKPAYSLSLDDDAIFIKDLRWAKKDAKACVILSSDGKLYHGSGQGPLSNVMEGVDSVDWSIRGNYIAVVKDYVVSILSSNFKEKLRFVLSFQSAIGDSDVNQVIKVDSIRWIRPDCLAVGCFQLNDDGEKENYIVQFITGRGRRITDASMKPIVLSFNDIFMDFCSDAVPISTGPHLFLSYLDLHGLAFVANRDLFRQLALFCWPHDSGKNEAAVVDILDDAWTVYLDSQANGEENVLLGLSVDKASQNENLKISVGHEEGEFSPCCVVICLTIDGKISVYHFASAIGALESAEGCAFSEEDDASEEPMKHEVPPISSGDGESRKLASLTSKSHEHSETKVEKISAMVTAAQNLSSSINLNIEPPEQTTVENMGSQTLKVYESKKALSSVLNKSSNAEHQSISEVVPSKGFFLGNVGANLSRQSINYPPVGSNMEPLPKMEPSTTTTSSWSLTGSNARDDASKLSDKVDNSYKNAYAGSILKHSTELKEKPVTFPSFGATGLSAQGNRNSVSSYPISQVSTGSTFASGKAFRSESKKNLDASPSQPPVMRSVQNATKQFGNVEEITNKLDNLLEDIEGKGGFLDASITSQTKYVMELEEGIRAISGKCRMWKGLLNEKHGEMQVLLEKTVEVLARKIYMEGLFKQTTDRKYWEFWNRKKLSSELELKQRRILELNQELTIKLIELERHFNSLEFNKFRENEGTQRDRRALQNRQGNSRQTQSLHSVHNTITAQLSAAEHLSGCLSKQMAALCIESSGKHDVKRQLFESIGLPYAGDGERSPATVRTSPADKDYSISSGLIGSSKEQSRRNHSSYVRGSEPQTARRRRDSLDSSWVNFDPPKSTVKRVLKADYDKGSPSRSLLNINKQYFSTQKKSEVAYLELPNISGTSLNHSKSKGIGASAEQLIESPSSRHHVTAGFQEHGIQLSPAKNSSAWLPPSISQRQMSQNSELGAYRDEKTKSDPPSTGTKYSANENKFFQQSDSNFRPLQSMSEQLPGQSRTSPFGSTGKSDHLKATVKDQKSETLLDAKLPVTSPFSFNSPLNMSGKSLFSSNSEKPSSLNDGQSASSPRQSVLGSSSPFSNNYPSLFSLESKPSSRLFATTPFGSEAKMGAKDEVSQLQTSVASAVTLPSQLPSSTGGSNFASVSSLSIITSEPSSVMSGSKIDLQTKVDNIPSKTETGAKIQTSALQPASVIPTSDLNLRTPASSVPTELSTNLKSESQDDIDVTSKNSSVVTSVIKAEIPSTTEAISTAAPSNEGINSSMKGAISNSSDEEEMEEEAPETNQTTEVTLANLGGFGIGSTQNSSPAKANPFGPTVSNNNSTFSTSPFMISESSGELFRPASFNFQPPQPLQPATVNFSGGFSSGVAGQASAPSGFGQPSQIGAGQQALGSVLGSFGQSRQLGAVLPGSNATSTSGGFGNTGGGFGRGFTTAPSSGGFGSLATVGGGFAAAATSGGGFAAAAGGGFAGAAPAGGGFGAAATAGVGFGSAATSGGGFGSAATSGGGFGAPATAGGGFGGAGAGASSGGGYGGFSSQPGSGGGGFGGFGNQSGSGGGFSPFGSGTAAPPSQLFTQMRK